MMAASTDKAQGYAAQYQAYPYHPPPMYPPAPGYAYIPVLPVHAPPGHLPIAPKPLLPQTEPPPVTVLTTAEQAAKEARIKAKNAAEYLKRRQEIVLTSPITGETETFKLPLVPFAKLNKSSKDKWGERLFKHPGLKEFLGFEIPEGSEPYEVPRPGPRGPYKKYLKAEVLKLPRKKKNAEEETNDGAETNDGEQKSAADPQTAPANRTTPKKKTATKKKTPTKKKKPTAAKRKAKSPASQKAKPTKKRAGEAP